MHTLAVIKEGIHNMNRSWRTYQEKLSERSFTKIKISKYKNIIKSVAALAIALGLIISAYLYLNQTKNRSETLNPEEIFKKAALSLKPSDINSPGIFRQFIPDNENIPYYIKLSLDKRFQESMERLLKQYKPPYAAIVGMDPETGGILAMASYSSQDRSGANYCLKSSFQAASIFKFVTAAAAVEKMNFGENSTIGFNGSLYRLKERNVFDKRARYANTMTLGEAFAKSVNIVFAKLTQKGIQSEVLRNYSSRFLFNQSIPFDLDVEISRASIPDEDYELARTAAGFGDVTLSPLHGALIVSAILNEGKMVSPYILEKIYNSDKTLLHSRTPVFSGNLIEPQTAHKIKNMMEMTLKKGTIRKTFRGWYRNRTLSDLNIGGKTGSLNGQSLPGEHDWFVGFAEDGEKKLVISSVIVNHSLWHIKPTYLAKEAFLTYFNDKENKRYYLANAR